MAAAKRGKAGPIAQVKSEGLKSGLNVGNPARLSPKRARKSVKNTLKTAKYEVGYGKPPVENQFKPGQSGNPGGRPKLLSDAYKQWLEAINEKDPQHRTNAELVAYGQGVEAIKGNASNAREIRQATEGDTLHLATWQTEIVGALKSGKLTAQDVVKELGLEDARAILIAAGQAVPADSPPGANGTGEVPAPETGS